MGGVRVGDIVRRTPREELSVFCIGEKGSCVELFWQLSTEAELMSLQPATWATFVKESGLTRVHSDVACMMSLVLPGLSPTWAMVGPAIPLC